MIEKNYHDYKVEPKPMPELNTLNQINNLKKRIELSKQVATSYAEEIQTATAELHELKTEHVLNPSTELIEKIKEKENEIKVLQEKQKAEKIEPIEIAPIHSAIEILKKESVIEAIGNAEVVYNELKERHTKAIAKHKINMDSLNESTNELLEIEAQIELSTRGLYYGLSMQGREPSNVFSPMSIFEGFRHIGRTDDYEQVDIRYSVWDTIEGLINAIKSNPEQRKLEVRETGYMFLPKKDNE